MEAAKASRNLDREEHLKFLQRKLGLVEFSFGHLDHILIWTLLFETSCIAAGKTPLLTLLKEPGSWAIGWSSSISLCWV